LLYSLALYADKTKDEAAMLYMGSGLMPAAAIIDYQLTLSLPS